MPDNQHMRIRFTKMQGAGNDFVVLDETRERLNLSPAQYRFLADRHFGVGADQILSVRPAPQADVDFEYGNGSRCFVRYVREQGLTDKTTVRVKVHGGVIALQEMPDGQVTVDMGAPIFDLPQVPFAPVHAQSVSEVAWQLALSNGDSVRVGVVSMGNPHAVQVVDNTDTAPVLQQGSLIEHHAAFPNRVNAGFMQVVDRTHVRLRVFERGAGETLACGTGACAAVVTGIRWGLLDAKVQVQTHGGVLTIEWQGAGHPVRMTGPATTVFQGEITLPDNL
jgi:diaminopimelate epimerase